MDIYAASKTAFDIFENELSVGITEAKESKDYWIFFAGSNKMIGRPGIAIEKSTGEHFFLQMPDKKTKLALIDAKSIDFPLEYKEKENK